LPATAAASVDRPVGSSSQLVSQTRDNYVDDEIDETRDADADATAVR